VSLPVRKKQKTERSPGEIGVFTPSPVGGARADRPSVHQSGSWSSGERTPALQAHSTPSRGARPMTPSAGGASSLTSRPSANFIKADANVRLSLVQDIVKSLDLVISRASNPLKVSEEEMAMADVFAKGVKVVAECQRLEGLVSQYQRHCERLQQIQRAAKAKRRSCNAS